MVNLERIRGGLVGLACGDAIGAQFEGMKLSEVSQLYSTPAALVSEPPAEVLTYTDDTEMALGVAEALRMRRAHATAADYAARYVANVDVDRGYGRGALMALVALDEGMSPADAARSYFPDGSFGNGAAMRVAPVGLVFADDPQALEEHVARSAAPTHAHPHGVEGARLIAHAVAYAATHPGFCPENFRDFVVAQVRVPEYGMRLDDVFAGRGMATGVAALESVPTALALAAKHADDYAECVGQAVLLGGDCDTIAAMAGAILGASHGIEGIPKGWRQRFERTPRGYGYVLQVAEHLAALGQLA